MTFSHNNHGQTLSHGQSSSCLLLLGLDLVQSNVIASRSLAWLTRSEKVSCCLYVTKLLYGTDRLL